MSASRNRPLWSQLPQSVRAGVERLVGGRVARAHNCAGGFSPGFASRLVLADGRRVFVKAIDADTWPMEAPTYRTEALVNASLPAEVPAPRLLGTSDDGHWTTLAFTDVDGAEPSQPWNRTDLDRVVAALTRLALVRPPSSVVLPRDHPRLGGWAELADDRSRRARLPTVSAWAAANLGRLVELEAEGLAAAHGDALVHFDLYPHNILLTPDRVYFVDWPHARFGAPVIDLVMVLSSAAAVGVRPEPVLRGPVAVAGLDLAPVDAILAAHAGFLINGGLSPMPAGLEAIAEAKLHLGLGAVDWLRERLTDRPA